MQRICAWCGTLLGDLVDSGHREHPVSHGICDTCVREVEAELPLSLTDFLESLDAPVLLVDPDHTVGAVNSRARALENGRTWIGRRIGPVFECSHAGDPGGCGLAVHCSGCTIRHAVRHTWVTGAPAERVPATLERDPDAGPDDIFMLVSTRRIGSRVLLRIELP
jgi:hypothetical protein